MKKKKIINEILESLSRISHGYQEESIAQHIYMATSDYIDLNITNEEFYNAIIKYEQELEYNNFIMDNIDDVDLYEDEAY